VRFAGNRAGELAHVVPKDLLGFPLIWQDDTIAAIIRKSTVKPVTHEAFGQWTVERKATEPDSRAHSSDANVRSPDPSGEAA
jgi:hypothetical protein